MSYDYDALVIGGGAAGLTAAGIAANFGAKTMMIERNKLGGDCTWTGCIPSKSLLKTAKVAHLIKNADDFGLTDQALTIDFGKVMEHTRKIRQEVYEDADKPEIFEDMGIDVQHGMASFVDDHTVQVESEDESRKVSSRYFFICTGSRPIVPPIGGLDSVDYLTNETLFELKDQPADMIMIGAGPIGTEMAQAFQRLGTQMAVIDLQERILSNDNRELADRLQDELESEGVEFRLGYTVSRVENQQGGRVGVSIEGPGGTELLKADRLLLAAGRQPNVETLDLESAGVEYSQSGITVNDKCRTSRRHVYACGDVTGRYQFTHMSEHMAKVATSNALLKVPMKLDTKHVPWVTFTDPELAHVGATEQQLQLEGASFETYRFPFNKIDRAITEGETTGLIKVFAKKWNGRILGASILGSSAGEMIGEYALAMRNGISLRQMADTIHPYPTYGLGARRAADQWYIKNQSEWQIKLLQKLFGYRGNVPDLSDPDRIV